MSTPSEHPNLHEENEDPDAFATWAVGIGGALITIATVAFACGISYSARESEAIKKNVNVVYEQRNMVRDAQQAVLEESAHWVSEHNPESGEKITRLVIPIDQAMEIVAGNTSSE